MLIVVVDLTIQYFILTKGHIATLLSSVQIDCKILQSVIFNDCLSMSDRYKIYFTGKYFTGHKTQKIQNTYLLDLARRGISTKQNSIQHHPYFSHKLFVCNVPQYVFYTIDCKGLVLVRISSVFTYIFPCSLMIISLSSAESKIKKNMIMFNVVLM